LGDPWAASSVFAFAVACGLSMCINIPMCSSACANQSPSESIFRHHALSKKHMVNEAARHPVIPG
jgi:hypothetical protein